MPSAFAHVTAHAYIPDFIRLGCDLMNWYFVYDEYTDAGDSSFAFRFAHSILDVLRNPNRSSSDEHVLPKMFRDFWLRAIAYVDARRCNNTKPATCVDRFINCMERYLLAVATEAKDRTEGIVRSVNENLTLRRKTSGAEPSLCFIEFGLDLGEEVFLNPKINTLTHAAVEMVVLDNVSTA